ALCSFAFLALMGERFFKTSARHTAAEELYQEALTLTAAQSEYYRLHRELDKKGLAENARSTNRRLIVLNNDNLVILDSDGLLEGQSIEAFDPAESNSYSRIGQFYGAFSESHISVFSPINVDFTLLGYLTLHQKTAVADRRANGFMGQAYLIYATVFLMSLSFLAALYFFVLRPLKTITEGAGEFAASHLDYRIRLSYQDDMGYLANTLNEMARQLQASDENQKRFIANVSHDFRSPLTSIKGYLEAMADGVIPPESQEKYLQILIGETERLTNLTQGILSLNSLEDARLGLELSNFDLVSTIRQICETFGGICEKRDISFDLFFSSAAIFVRADLGRINQVMHNLIDNAIKFSHNGGLIIIQVQALGNKAFICVKDFGVGIKKEDLGKIWNRFYKSDASRGKDKKGTGLGLSITKEIIAAHGETIDVTSTPGSGTEFLFRLPLAKEKDKKKG
ncbi:MAG: HAMP domain-containing histidine kinase, partial [Lachnospiraceae bacterium]|nr:HAMP domain-containing histidine kinase [Lachnospiraceae bacterium]